jgi:hypoxanthine phosphoribosyltransferase
LEVLLSREEIRRRVIEMGKEIARDHPVGTPLLIGVLSGCVIFFADLMKSLPIPHEIDFVSVSSYQNASASSGRPRLIKDLERSIEGRDVVIVDDIIDSGHTLEFLRATLLSRNPRSLKIAALLDKRDRRVQPVPIDYVGFVIPDRFVVGYGLDFAERFRHLPYIAALEPGELSREAAASATVPGG